MVSSTAVTTKVASGSPYQLEKTQVSKASSALLRHIKSKQVEKEKSATKKTLIGDNDESDDETPLNNEAVWLVVTTKKHVVDKNRLKPGKITVPHSLNDSSNLSVCLITADPQRSVKNIVTDPSFPEHLTSRIDRSFESRRQLLSEHDVFLADDRIILRLSSKRPIPISIAKVEKKDGKRVKKDPKQKSKEEDSAFASPAIVAKEIEKALHSAPVQLAPATTASIRIGSSKFTPEQLSENVDAVVQGLTEKFITKGWRNIKALHIKGATTMAMPIWLANELWVEEGDVAEDTAEADVKALEGAKNKKRKQSAEDEKLLEANKKSKKPKAADEDEDTAARKEKLQKQKAKALEDGNVAKTTESATKAGKKKRNHPPAKSVLIIDSNIHTIMIPIARHSALRAVRSQLAPRAFNQSALARLLSTLAVLEQRDGKLQTSSLSAIAAAQKLGGPITAFVAGNGVKGTSAAEAAKIKGLDKVVAVDSEAYEKGLPENYAPLLVENIKKGEYTHIIGGHSAFGKSLLPRVAALLDVQQVSDITGIESEDTFVRPIYAGNAILTVQSSDPIKILTVRGTAFQGVETEGGSAEVVEGVDPKAPAQTEWVSEELAKSERPDLGTAARVVSGGRGLKSKEEFDRVIVPLADTLGAAIGASRAAVDSGFADNSLQVGQTGKNVAPQLYLCAGISGAIQHLAGMKDSKVIAAINKDPDAPIFQVADVGLVGDLFEKVPELTEKLKSQA
ncbi:hypothetical protein BDV38DRAFT_270893 [Aspergillus pseudotamarii]|uniref:Probable electron transfer flavoprotein subunit alpha, mitochondrial n=1 Tax=Aspergillus pseudotamarii TaxID=132259 RepID=A0A5N6ST39_ASPPS|nr:uncharacterized protein BDV38DRAFT_270893 [Aspergillus pseudotamarii]KAE8137856.1 hypothetical protein BDV38DRAFT_270893 [Aspergillus pseudotamarii]